MKTVVFFAILGAAAWSSASFEMMLIPDKNITSGSSYKVHRFDPTNGSYFGSFQVPSTTADFRIAAGYATGLAYFADTTFLRAYNYSTGELKQRVTVGANDLTLSNDGLKLYAANRTNNTIAVYDARTLVLSGTLTVSGATAITRINMDDFGYLQVIDAVGKKAFVVNPTTSAVLGSAAFDAGTTSVGQLSKSRFIDSKWGYGLFVRNGSTTIPGLFWSYSQSVAFFGGWNSIGIGLSTMTGIAAGHDGVYYVGNDSTNASLTRVRHFEAASGLEEFSFTTSIVVKPGEVAVVVAPEPGSLLALLGGVALLTRGRRRS